MKQVFFSLIAFLLMTTGASCVYAGQASPAPSPTPIVSAPVVQSPVQHQGKIQRFAAKMTEKLHRAVEDDRWLIALLLLLVAGSLGVHRVYLGGKPSLVIVYFLLSCIGIGFIICLIDLIVLITDKNTSRFEGNDKLIVW